MLTELESFKLFFRTQGVSFELYSEGLGEFQASNEQVPIHATALEVPQALFLFDIEGKFLGSLDGDMGVFTKKCLRNIEG